MNELYFWGSAVVVGLILLKAIPAEKLRSTNNKMREKISGGVLAVLYVLIGVLFFVSTYFLCEILNVNVIAKNVLTGAILGAFIGFIPLVDSRYANNGDKDNKL